MPAPPLYPMRKLRKGHRSLNHKAWWLTQLGCCQVICAGAGNPSTMTASWPAILGKESCISSRLRKEAELHIQRDKYWKDVSFSHWRTELFLLLVRENKKPVSQTVFSTLSPDNMPEPAWPGPLRWLEVNIISGAGFCVWLLLSYFLGSLEKWLYLVLRCHKELLGFFHLANWGCGNTDWRLETYRKIRSLKWGDLVLNPSSVWFGKVDTVSSSLKRESIPAKIHHRVMRDQNRNEVILQRLIGELEKKEES